VSDKDEQRQHERATENMVSMLKYVDTIAANQKEQIEQARASMEKRLDGMNEFRSTLKDQALSYMTRAEWQTAHTSMQGDIRQLQAASSTREGSSSGRDASFATVLSIMSLVLTAVIGIVATIALFHH
jgi:hypothetical protein